MSHILIKCLETWEEDLSKVFKSFVIYVFADILEFFPRVVILADWICNDSKLCQSKCEEMKSLVDAVEALEEFERVDNLLLVFGKGLSLVGEEV